MNVLGILLNLIIVLDHDNPTPKPHKLTFIFFFNIFFLIVSTIAIGIEDDVVFPLSFKFI